MLPGFGGHGEDVGGCDPSREELKCQPIPSHPPPKPHLHLSPYGPTALRPQGEGVWGEDVWGASLTFAALPAKLLHSARWHPASSLTVPPVYSPLAGGRCLCSLWGSKGGFLHRGLASQRARGPWELPPGLLHGQQGSWLGRGGSKPRSPACSKVTCLGTF